MTDTGYWFVRRETEGVRGERFHRAIILFMKQNRPFRWTAAAVFGLVSLTFFRLWYTSRVPLSADEAYFWVWSRHPAFCYYDQPPMIAWLMAFFTRVIGNTEAGVRAASPFALLAISFLLIAHLGEESGDHPEKTLLPVILLAVIPGFAVAALLGGVEAPLLLFSMAAVLSLHRAIIRGRTIFWYSAGIFFGLGLLTKYLIVLLLPGLLAFFLLSRPHRNMLRSPHPWCALLLSLAIFSPVVFWNAHHDWSNFILNVLHRHKQPFHLMPDIGTFGLFIAGQAVLISPLLLILLFFCFSAAARRAFGEKDPPSLFLVCLAGFIFLFLGAHALFLEMPEPHWAGTGYLLILLMIPPLIVRRPPGRAFKIFLAAGVILAAAMTTAIHVIPLSPTMRALLPLPRETAARVNAFLDNWPRKMALAVTALQRDAVPTGKKPLILCRGFALASLTEFSLPDQEEVFMAFQNGTLGHGYYYWQDINRYIGRDFIFVDDDAETSHLPELQKAFTTVEKAGHFTIFSDGMPAIQFCFYRCYNLKGMERRKPVVLDE